MKFYLDSERPQGGHVLLVEIGHRTGPQFDGALVTFARLDEQAMPDKIELDFERLVSEWNRGRGQAARRDVERYVPPVVHQWRKLPARLAHNLRPHVQSVKRA